MTEKFKMASGPPSSITILLIILSNLIIKSRNVAGLFHARLVIRIGLYFRDCIIWDDRKIQDGVRTTILEYCFVKHFVKTAHDMLMRHLQDSTVGPTGRSNRLVKQLDQQLRRPTGCSNRLDESNMSNQSNRLKQRLHRWNVHSTVRPTVGPTKSLKTFEERTYLLCKWGTVPNQPIEWRRVKLRHFLSAKNVYFWTWRVFTGVQTKP